MEGCAQSGMQSWLIIIDSFGGLKCDRLGLVVSG